MTQESDFITRSILTSLEKNQEGIALIDKPTGWTSHDVVNKVRGITRIKRVGHAGTLDPLATGLLIVLIGREFTKMQDSFMKQPKEYLVTAQFGITTDSYDSDGEVVSEAKPEKTAELTQQQIEKATKPFIGTIDQQVPIFSAVKVGGKKLYQHGRMQREAAINETVPDIPKLPIKQVSVQVFDLLKLDLPYAEFRVECSSGTYVRSLIHDLGASLGTGATVTQLRRTKIGSYHVKDSIQLLPEK
jgi:tRNA pseudouridine55 synthase